MCLHVRDDDDVHRCGAEANRREVTVDPVDGGTKYVGKHGELSRIPYPPCRDVTDGDCPLFERKVVD